MTVAHRMMDARDERFVLDSWAKSYRESDHAGLIQNADWFGIMLPQLEKIIRRPEVSVTIAYDPRDIDRIADIHGWICAETVGDREIGWRPYVYYVLVKGPDRGHGIARGLLHEIGVELVLAGSHWHRTDFEFACKSHTLEENEGKFRRLAPDAKFRPRRGRH